MSALIINPNRLVQPTTGEQEIIRQLYSDPDVRLDGAVDNLHVRRTSSRVCFSVEHGDYNGTRLFGAAIGVEPEKAGDANGFIWFAYVPIHDKTVRIKSLNVPDIRADFRLGEIPDASEVSSRASRPWTKFPMGVSYILGENGYPLKNGLRGVLFGKIPEGGLSRSASLTLNIMLSMLEANEVDASEIDPLRIIKMAQAVENKYVGSPCGDLDQAMIYLGQAEKGTVYSPRKKLIEHVGLPSDAPDFRLVVMDTATKRAGLKGTTYETRQRECRQIVDMFGQEYGFETLADVTPSKYGQVQGAIRDSEKLGEPDRSNLAGRLKYIFEAKMRLTDMLLAWRRGDAKFIGETMNADGRGLRSDYNISGPQLETMVDLARGDPDFLGGRMAGGGDYGAAQGIRLNTPIGPFREMVLRGYGRSWPEYAEHAAVHNCQLVDGCVKLMV